MILSASAGHSEPWGVGAPACRQAGRRPYAATNKEQHVVRAAESVRRLDSDPSPHGQVLNAGGDAISPRVPPLIV
jgi:hypothetical protein